MVMLPDPLYSDQFYVSKNRLISSGGGFPDHTTRSNLILLIIIRR